MTYSCGDPPLSVEQISDKIFFEEQYKLGSLPNLKAQRLLAFPSEKHRNKQYKFEYKDYLDKVWERAKKLIAGAEEVWIIGYSFSAVDRKYVLDELLSDGKSCKRFIVQNPDAERICTMLRLKHPELEDRLVPFTSEF